MNDETQRLRLQHADLQRGMQRFCILEGGKVVFASGQFSASFALVAGDPRDACSVITAPVDAARVQAAMNEVDATGSERRITFTALRRSGPCFQAVATIARIDAYRERPLLLAVEELPEQAHTVTELTLLAFNDALTALPNRARLLDDLRAILLRSRRHGGMVGLLVADLDGFKAVNDRYGHAVGDQVLVRAARCMEDAVREGDLVARLGGDEFAVVLPRLAGMEDAALVAGRLIGSLARSAGAHPAGVSIGVSVGVAAWPTHGDSIDEIFSSADDAMYQAKRGGKNRYCVADRAGERAEAKRIHFFDWGADRNLGVAGMDEDHRGMAALINELGDELKSGRDEARLDACMQRLVLRTSGHFAREERWMDRHDYPQRVAHKAEHARLLEDLSALGMRLDSRSMILTMRHLQNWLCRHVEDSDRKLARAALSLPVAAGARDVDSPRDNVVEFPAAGGR